MKLSQMDIVYFVKDNPVNEELRYSLRSVEKNFPHRRVWFVGGKPVGLEPDAQFSVSQESNKWENVSDMIKQVCLNDEVSDEFVLFNDDFFVLKPFDPEQALPSFFNGSLSSLAAALRKKRGASDYITKRIEPAMRKLLSKEMPQLNFELHVPMAINKEKMKRIYEVFPGVPCKRSLYGNYYVHDISPTEMSDCKITRLDVAPRSTAMFVSTSDISFSHGQVGSYLRTMFREKSRFEK